MAEVRPPGPEHFDQVYPLLLRFGHAAMSREDWRRMLFDLPWPVEEPHRGYMLLDGDAVVGFLGTIFSRRELGGATRRICNLSSWIVDERHRTSSFQLLLPVLSMKSHTIVNLSASREAHEIFRALGFQTLEDRQTLVVPIPGPRDLAGWPRCSVHLRPEAIRGRLAGAGLRIFDDMRGTVACQVLLADRERSCHLVATSSPWKGRMRLAHIQYASDWTFLTEHGPQAAWALYRRMGTAGLRLDGRRAGNWAPPLSARRPILLPQLYRPAEPDMTAQLLDGLYTEVVNQRW